MHARMRAGRRDVVYALFVVSSIGDSRCSITRCMAAAVTAAATTLPGAASYLRHSATRMEDETKRRFAVVIDQSQKCCG